MSRILGFVMFSLASMAIAGCAQFGSKPGIERADDLGLQLEPANLPALPPLPPLPAPSAPEASDRLYRDGFVEQWMSRSDYLCRQYKDKIILISRNTRFASDAATTILSGLATIFTAVGTIHPLTGAATIISGVGAAAQTDTFEQQSGEIIAAAIQTARENQATQIETNLKLSPTEYNIYRAQRDVIDYHNMCSLETALSQVRASLKATAPDEGKTPPAAQGVPPAEPRPPITVPPSIPAPLPRSPTGPIVLTPVPQVGIVGAISQAERRMNPAEGRKVQAALCLKPDSGTVNFGPATRAAIEMFRTVGGHEGPTDGLTAPEAILLSRTPSCDTRQFANAFEYFQYSSDTRATSADKITRLQQRLAANLPAGHPPGAPTGAFDKNTRAVIADIQRANNRTPTGQVTRDFLDLLIK